MRSLTQCHCAVKILSVPAAPGCGRGLCKAGSAKAAPNRVSGLGLPVSMCAGGYTVHGAAWPFLGQSCANDCVSYPVL